MCLTMESWMGQDGSSICMMGGILFEKLNVKLRGLPIKVCVENWWRLELRLCPRVGEYEYLKIHCILVI